MIIFNFQISCNPQFLPPDVLVISNFYKYCLTIKTIAFDVKLGLVPQQHCDLELIINGYKSHMLSCLELLLKVRTRIKR